MVRRAAVSLPGTCGELFQGTVDGEPCLVSCPIDRFGMADVELCDGGDWMIPPDSPKAWRALHAGRAHHRSAAGGRLRLWSDLPRGRGYGSSSVDVGGTLFALGRALDQPPTPSEVARLAAAIEPTESTLFPGLALFAHRDGRWHEPLGSAPPLEIVIVDPGGEVDTVVFNRLDHVQALKRLAPTHARIFEDLKRAMRHRDWAGLGAASSESAEIHQAILYSEWCSRVSRLAHDLGALGVCRAHSGTIWGVLLDPVQADTPAIEAHITAAVPNGVCVSRRRMASGGPRHLTPLEKTLFTAACAGVP